MFTDLIIAKQNKLFNFFKGLKLDLYLTKPQINHFKNALIATLCNGFKGKLTDICQLALSKHKSSISRFFSSSSWDDSLIFKSLRNMAIDFILKKSKETGKPIYFIIDDTISEKTKPSSKAKNPISKCSFHNSHLKKKVIYGHQIVVSLLSCDGLVLPYSIDIYDKKSMSKIDIAINLINSLPKPINKGYVLCDSWYSCKSIFKASLNTGYDYVGAIKTNRVIYPNNHKRLGIKLSKFALSLPKDSFDLVTIGGREYYIHSYCGKLNNFKRVSITLSYPKDAFKKEGTLKAFISLDTLLDSKQLLHHYTNRWVIETFFRDCKNYLGLNSYQIRSEKSIKRYYIIMISTYIYCKIYSHNNYSFNIGLKQAKISLKKSSVLWIYEKALNGTPINVIFQTLKIA